MPLPGFDANRVVVESVLTAIENDDIEDALARLSEARRSIFHGTRVISTNFKGEPPQSFVHPDRDRYQELHSLLQRVQQLLIEPDTSAAKQELRRALQVFGYVREHDDPFCAG